MLSTEETPEQLNTIDEAEESLESPSSNEDLPIE